MRSPVNYSIILIFKLAVIETMLPNSWGRRKFYILLLFKKYTNNTESITDTKFEDIPLDDSKLFFKIIYSIINRQTRQNIRIPPEFAMNINYYKEHLKRVLPVNYLIS